MSQLIVRQLEPEVVRALRERATRARRSAEAEHRHILRQALLGGRAKRSLKELLLAMPEAGDDRDFRRPKDRGRPVAL
jgi:plasmid stability protein